MQKENVVTLRISVKCGDEEMLVPAIIKTLRDYIELAENKKAGLGACEIITFSDKIAMIVSSEQP
jgi:hypothetical protein